MPSNSDLEKPFSEEREREARRAARRAAQELRVQREVAQFDSLPDSAHVREPVVRTLHGISRSTVWRWVRAGTLPAPVKLGQRIVTWRVGDLRRCGLHNAAQ